jgi:prephenate dehydrogenase/chorismate mutase
MKQTKLVSKAKIRGKSNSKELEHLRKEISLTTESIMKLVKRRQDLATKVAQIKSSSDLPIENLAVEKKLKEEVSKYASNIELDGRLAVEILDVLLSASKIAQRKIMFEKKIISFLRENKIKVVSIIGVGRMGRWFANYFKILGRKVVLFDARADFAKNLAKELGCDFAIDIRKIATQSDLIFVAVPISKTRHTIDRLQDTLRKSNTRNHCKAIIEISSIKAEVLEHNFKGSQVPIISIHPLFGPSATQFGSNETIALVKQERSRNRGFASGLVKHLFPQFKVIEIQAKAHDKQMALMLSLPHTLALAFADVITRNSNLIKDKSAVTTSYSTLREFASKALAENPDVYYEIQSMNKFTPQVLKALGISVATLSLYLERGERLKFRKLFDLTRRKIEPML